MLTFKTLSGSLILGSLFVAGGALAFADTAAGVKALEKKDYATAYKELKSGADNGDPVAMADLGLMYARGLGIGVDVPQAMELWQAAASKGYAPGAFYLGLTYEKGWGVQQNLAEASHWLEMAATQGDGRAQREIGTLYEDGYGVQQDYKVAAQYYQLAAKNGSARAMFRLSQLTEKGKGVKRDETAAIDLCKKSAEKGYAPAQERLGAMYASGFASLKADPAQALFWSTLAAKQNEKNAERRLASLSAKLSADEATRVTKSAADWKPILAVK